MFSQFRDSRRYQVISAGSLLVLGLGLMVGSKFVGNTVSADKEWSQDQQAEYERIAASVHSPATDRKSMQNRDRLKEMQQQLLDLKRAAEAKKRRLYGCGVVACLLGVSLAIWSRFQGSSSV